MPKYNFETNWYDDKEHTHSQINCGSSVWGSMAFWTRSDLGMQSDPSFSFFIFCSGRNQNDLVSMRILEAKEMQIRL